MKNVLMLAVLAVGMAILPSTKAVAQSYSAPDSITWNVTASGCPADLVASAASTADGSIGKAWVDAAAGTTDTVELAYIAAQKADFTKWLTYYNTLFPHVALSTHYGHTVTVGPNGLQYGMGGGSPWSQNKKFVGC